MLHKGPRAYYLSEFSALDLREALNESRQNGKRFFSVRRILYRMGTSLEEPMFSLSEGHWYL